MLSKLSVKKPYTVIVGIILVIVLGYISFQHMTTDLLPSMNLPYVVVYTPYPGATPEQVEGSVTRPMEAAFATLTDVKKITSQSRDNVSVVIMQFNDGANMDTALIEISSQLDQLKGGFADEVGAPVALKLNPDMLPVAILSVTRDDMDILELSDYVTDELVPAFESLNGVASANASGVIQQEIDVTIEQARIDVLNSAILKDLDEQLSEVERQLIDGQAQISDGRRQLAQAKGMAYGMLGAALDALENGQAQIGPAIEQLTQQRDALASQRESVEMGIAAMEAVQNMSDAEKAAAKQAANQVAELLKQRNELKDQLAKLLASENSPAAALLADATAQRDALTAQREAQRAYIDDLRGMNADGLKAEIAQLEQDVVDAHTRRDAAQAELNRLTAERDELKAQVDSLKARIALASGTSTQTPAPTDAPEARATPTDTTAPETTPESTDNPEGSAAPTDTAAPADTAAATNTAAPADTAVPTDTAAPADTHAAENTDAPEATAAPADPTAAPAASAADAVDNAMSALRRMGAAFAEEADLAGMQAELDEKQAKLDALEAEIADRTAEVARENGNITNLNSRLTAKRGALSTLTEESENIETRVAEAQARIAVLDGQIAALDQEIALLSGDTSALGDAQAIAERLADLDQQLDQLEAALPQMTALLDDDAALASQLEQAKSGLAQIDDGIAQMDSAIEKLQSGIVPGGFIDGIDEDTNLSDARDKLLAAQGTMGAKFAEAEAMLNKAAAEIAKARKEFNEKRDEAFEQAGLDGVITVQMVSGLIGAQNFSMPAGYVKDADADQVLVRVGDKFGALDELRNMKLFSLGLDSIDEVRLLDVADVQLTDDRDEVFTKLNGQDGILLSMEKQSTYSTADVADTILARARELQEKDPSLHIVDLMNQGEYIDIVVDSVLGNLLVGGGLAILILLLFLMDWRPTLTVAFSIPISVVIAFVCMYFSGITLNVLSLSGLALGIGMLVDNSIVAIENIYRLHDEERLPLLRACVEGVKSVSGALFASTLTTICVFLPIVFVQGMARDLFADMGLTIAYSLLASLFVAMTVVPMMCSFLMRRSKPKKHSLFKRIQAGYSGLLKGALRVKPLVLLAAVALLAFSGMQVAHMGISFMPEVNSRQMSASLTPDPEMPLKDQKAQAVDIMNDMLGVEGIQSIGLMDGSGTMLSAGGGGYSYYIIVDEESGRKNRDIARDIDAIGAKYGADITAQASTMDISMLTGSGISVEITGDDIEVLQSIAADVAELARSTEGVADVDDGLEDAVPEMRVVVDKEKAISEGLTTAQVYQFIAQKLMGKIDISKVTLDGKELQIELIEGRSRGLTPQDIQELEMEVDGETENKRVRIGDISEVRDAQSLATIHRASQRRMVTVTFTIADGYSANLVSDAFEQKLNDYALPAGYNADLAGENETVMDIMEDLVWMILVAILLIFLIMVAQFQSFKSPIIVMFTIPLAFTGGLLALILTKMDLSIVAMLGFLVLSGVVVNNGIVFIDCVNQLRIAGMEKKEALIEAGRQRLRPILMTALTTILGMSTMALGQGTGAEMMQPMAVVSIGGLTYATLMTLFVVPVLYDLFNGKTMKAREIQMIREAAGMNGDEVLEDGYVAGEGSGTAAETAAPSADDRPVALAAETPAAPVEMAVPVTPPAAVAPAVVETPATPPETVAAVTSVTPTGGGYVPAPVPPVPVFTAKPGEATGPKPIRVKLSAGKRRKRK